LLMVKAITKSLVCQYLNLRKLSPIGNNTQLF